MITQINLSYKSYLFINMISHMIFINIENYHKSYFYKKLSSKFKIYFIDK